MKLGTDHSALEPFRKRRTCHVTPANSLNFGPHAPCREHSSLAGSGNHQDGSGFSRAKIAFGVLSVILMLAESGVAQNMSKPARLTLQAALDLADKQNLDLAAARQRRAVRLAGVRIAQQRPNPTFNFTALRDEPHEGFFFNQPLEIGGKRHRRMEVARQEGALTDVEITTLARQIRRNTREAFYSLAFARAESERLAEVLKLAQRLEKIAEERFKTGAVAQLEVIQAGLEVSRVQADFKFAEQQEKVSLSQFNALLNESASTPWELAESLHDLPPTIPLPELIQRAYGSNPELQHVAQEQKIEQSRRGLLRAERIPNLDVEFGTDFNSPRDFRVGPRGQISLIVPLFSRHQGEIAQSFANQRVLEAEEAATRRGVAGRVEAAAFHLQAQQTQAQIYRETLLPAARQLESMAEESYRAGKTNILAVIGAQRNVQEVERQYLGSLWNLQSAFAGLEETVGAPLDGK